MTITSIFTLFSILMAWSIHALLSQFIKKEGVLKFYQKAIWRTLGILGVVMLTGVIYEWGGAYILGYFYEQVAFVNRMIGDVSIFYIGFEILLPIIMSLNMFKGVRNNNKFRTIQVVCISLYLGMIFQFFGIDNIKLTAFITPGWHTTVGTVGAGLGTFIWLIIILILNLLIANHTKKTASL